VGEDIAGRARTKTRHRTVAAGIKVVSGDENGRFVVRVVATDFKSHWFEFGTVKMAAQPFLQPAAIEAGYTLTAGTRI
jgi:uncharacterized phage protein gp47/JayE